MSNEPKHTATPIETYSVFDKCSLTDIELIKKVSEWNTKLCDSGGKKWTLQVPPNVNEDPDLLIQELCLRFESLKQDNEQLSAQIDHDFNELKYIRAENAELIEALRLGRNELERAKISLIQSNYSEQSSTIQSINNALTTLAKYEKP